MKYTCKASLRQHIIKHFPMKNPNDVAHLDIIPFLNEGWVPGDQETADTETGAVRVEERDWKPVENEEVPVVIAAAEAGSVEGEINPVAFICESKWILNLMHDCSALFIPKHLHRYAGANSVSRDQTAPRRAV